MNVYCPCIKPGCHILSTQWPVTMLAVLLVSVGPLLAAAAVEQPAEISDEDLKSINKANDLSLK